MTAHYTYRMLDKNAYAHVECGIEHSTYILNKTSHYTYKMLDKYTQRMLDRTVKYKKNFNKAAHYKNRMLDNECPPLFYYRVCGWAG